MDKTALLRKIDEMCAGVGMNIQLDGVIWPIFVAGVKARLSVVQSPMLNLVGMAEFTEENVDNGIQNVINLYRQEGKIFGWLVGPSTQPANLGEQLLAAGLMKIEDECMRGMVLPDLNHSIQTNPTIRVEQVAISEWDANKAMMARAYGFGMTEEVIEPIIRFHESFGEQAKVYLAYADDREDPISFSSAFFDNAGEIILLGGAATVEEYRGKGVYSSMVAKRLEDARDMGYTIAIVQAVKGTSAPLCEKLGFESVSEIDFYAYIPSGEVHG